LVFRNYAKDWKITLDIKDAATKDIENSGEKGKAKTRENFEDLMVSMFKDRSIAHLLGKPNLTDDEKKTEVKIPFHHLRPTTYIDEAMKYA